MTNRHSYFPESATLEETLKPALNAQGLRSITIRPISERAYIAATRPGE
jgi:hypothetical protein